MAPVYRAYGQIRRGSGPWRRPFLIPTAPLLGHEGYISVDDGGAQPDLRCQLRVLNFTSLDDFRVGFLISKVRPVTDITLRLLLLKSADAFFVDTGPLEQGVSFAVLQHRTLPGLQFPGDLKINVDVGRPLIDPLIDDPATPVTSATGMRATAIRLSVESGLADDLELAGGLVDGDMVAILGVETQSGAAVGGYRERDNQLRGIDLGWLDGAGPKPPSATWVDLTAANPTPDPTTLDVTINLPETGEPPTAAPAVAAVAGGTMRAGVYRYRLVYVTENGNETAAGPRSGPVTIGAGASDPRSVRVDGFPPLPPDAEPSGPLRPTKIRVYRTDPDVPDPLLPPDPRVGDTGDDVRVAELPITATTFTDTGSDPLASGSPDVIKHDLILLDYAAPHSPPLDLTGGIRLIGTDTTGAVPVTTDERYTGAITAAPAKLRVAYQPQTAPRLRWSATAPVPLLRVGLAPLETPLGAGVDVTATGVPTRLGIDFVSLGSEYFALALVAATSLDPGRLGSEPIGRASARLGTAAPPPAWPAGDAAVAVELTTELAAPPTAAGGLAALTGVRRAVVTSGARPWSQRDANRGRLGIEGTFAAVRGLADRDLRITRRSGGDDPLQHLHLTGHELPDVVTAALWTPPGDAPTRLELDTRVRWLRGDVTTRSEPPGVPVSRMSGRLLVDHSSDRLRAEIGAGAVTAELAAPARAGGRLDLTTDGEPAAARVVVRPDAVVPSTGGGAPLQVTGLAEDALELEATVPEPGLSGRVAASFGDDLPVVVRANPQLKLLQHGDREATTGLRAVSARVQGVLGADVPRTLLAMGDDTPAPGEIPVTVELHKERPNQSFRAEAQVRERRVGHPADDRAVAGVRSWLRARVASVPPRVDATPAFVAAGAPTGSSFGGIALRADDRWGDGEVFAEPGFVWEANTGELGEDRGIGLVCAQFDGLPAVLEAWLLQHAGDLGAGRVPVELRLPSVGPVNSAWPPGGVLARVDGPLRLTRVRAALPGDGGRACRTDDGDDHAVRHGTWSDVRAPFIRLVPTAGGIVRAVIWSTGDAPAPVPVPPPPEPDPCSAGDPPERKTAIGWDLDAEVRVSLAVRLLSLNTPSGRIVPRWWAMPTSSEEWEGVDDPRCGTWWLEQELQMKEYRNVVAFYEAETLDNPFGDWEGGPGTWWLRIRDGLDAFLGSGDAYMGNVGGGYHFLPSNGIFSTLPAIWNASVWNDPIP